MESRSPVSNHERTDELSTPRRVILRLELSMEPKMFDIPELFLSKRGYAQDQLNDHHIHYEVREHERFHIIIDLNSALNLEIDLEEVTHEIYRVMDSGSEM